VASTTENMNERDIERSDVVPIVSRQCVFPPPRVLVACEKSGRVREAFNRIGCDAYSCDLLPSEDGGQHIQGDVREILNDRWDLLIAHPPCTYLSYVGIRHWHEPGRAEKREEAMRFFLDLYNAPIEKVCIENPVGYPNTVFRKPDQIIHPMYFGKPQLKRTCLWLRGLKPLEHRAEDDLFGEKTHTEKPKPMYYLKTTGKPIHWTEGNHRSETRSRTFVSIAKAMAEQWGHQLVAAKMTTHCA
jgi:hypothetical protein